LNFTPEIQFFQVIFLFKSALWAISYVVVTDTHINNGNEYGLEKLKDVIKNDRDIKIEDFWHNAIYCQVWVSKDGIQYEFRKL
jgi:hypothetical protein